MNRRGRPVTMLVECFLLHSDDDAHEGVIVVMNEADEQK
jgi:hypothetical protein